MLRVLFVYNAGILLADKQNTTQLSVWYLKQLWQECQFWNRMFEEELSKINVGEIWQLLVCSDVDQE
jgi:hypothetical protein